MYSFSKHNREEKTTTIYSPHVLILEGIFGLHDQRVLDLLDLKVSHRVISCDNSNVDTHRFLRTPSPTCVFPDDVSLRELAITTLLTRCPLVVRDVKSRGRDIEGCIKQWFLFVKPNFHRYVAPQREVAGKGTSRHSEAKLDI